MIAVSAGDPDGRRRRRSADIENLFTPVYRARAHAQIEIDLRSRKMAVESVSAAETLIQRFASNTTTLRIFFLFPFFVFVFFFFLCLFDRWDRMERGKFRE